MSSPHPPAGLHVAACQRAHCAYPNHLPWLLGVLGGAGLQLGRVGLTGSLGEAERIGHREKEKIKQWSSLE